MDKKVLIETKKVEIERSVMVFNEADIKSLIADYLSTQGYDAEIIEINCSYKYPEESYGLKGSPVAYFKNIEAILKG